MAADGVANAVIAEEVGVTPVTVRAWRTRFGEDGLAGLEQIREGRGRKPSISEETIAEIVGLTTKTTPPGATHWSCRHDGEAGRSQSGDGATDLVRAGAAAPSGRHVQGQPTIRGSPRS